MIKMRQAQTGVGLIEVLIAVLVLAVGVLGIAALQSITLRNTGTSAERSQAAIQTYSMLDTLRTQRAAAIAGSLNTASGYQCSTATALGAAGSVTGWLADLRMTVSPSACGKVACTTTSGVTTCLVGVRWSEARATGGDQTTPYAFETSTRL